MVSGSFALYLLNHYGAAHLKRLFFEAFPGNFHKKFKDIYGQSLSYIEEEWKNFCRSYLP